MMDNYQLIALERFSPKEFADFLSENGFPECKDYFIQSAITYPRLMKMRDVQIRSWTHSIDSFDYNRFSKFRQELKNTLETILNTTNATRGNSTGAIAFGCDGRTHQNSLNHPNRTKPIMPIKPNFSFKPIPATKPNIQCKPITRNNSSQRNSFMMHSRSTSSDSVEATQFAHNCHSQENLTEAQLTEKLPQRSNTLPKKLPVPPSSFSIAAVPALPDYFDLDSIPRSLQDTAIDPPDNEDAHSADEDEYWEAADSLTPPPEPPQIDRTMHPKPPQRKSTALRALGSAVTTAPANVVRPRVMNDEDDDDEEDEMHVYEEMPQSLPGVHRRTRQNTYTAEPTRHLMRQSVRSEGLYDGDDYLVPRRHEATGSAPQLSERSRPLPPTPVQEYTLSHLRHETYFRPIDRKTAEKLLKYEPIGAFLVRPSKKFFCSLSIKSATKIFHVGTVKKEDNKFHLMDQNPESLIPFHSITDLMNFYITNGISLSESDKITSIALLNVMKSIS